MADNYGQFPLNYLCGNRKIEKMTAIDILKLLIEKHPEAVRHANNRGSLPIHIAAMKENSPEFCQVLIEAYPGSERITESTGFLPLHLACLCGRLATVQYLYKLYPDSINHTTRDGFYPIHSLIQGINPENAAEIAKFLLNSDPNVKLQKWREKSLLIIACCLDYQDLNIFSRMEVIDAIYDAHPELIEDDELTSNMQDYHFIVQRFLNSELVFARQAIDHGQMTSPDGNGQLPLHRALQNKVRLGSIKLLVKGNPNALHSADHSGVLPLHIACQHHDSADVVRYLIALDTTTLGTVDREGNTALHYACRGANYDTIATLLKAYDAVSVSHQNAHKKLPIDLLWESGEVEDRNGREYVENVFRLLKAYPETVITATMKEQVKAGDYSPQNSRKRKFGK